MIISISGPAASGKTQLVRKFTQGKNTVLATPRDLPTAFRLINDATEYLVIDECDRLDSLTWSALLNGFVVMERFPGPKTKITLPAVILAGQLTLEKLEFAVECGHLEPVRKTEVELSSYGQAKAEYRILAYQRTGKKTVEWDL